MDARVGVRRRFGHQAVSVTGAGSYGESSRLRKSRGAGAWCVGAGEVDSRRGGSAKSGAAMSAAKRSRPTGNRRVCGFGGRRPGNTGEKAARESGVAKSRGEISDEFGKFWREKRGGGGGGGSGAKSRPLLDKIRGGGVGRVVALGEVIEIYGFFTSIGIWPRCTSSIPQAWEVGGPY